MPTFLPPVTDLGMVRPDQTYAQQRIARIVGTLPTGKTLIKANGRWYCKLHPTMNELAAATYYFLGGHEYEISDELYAEIVASVGPDCQPTIVDHHHPRLLEDGTERLLETGETRELEALT